MFQYAYGRNLELAGKKVVFDVSFFNGNRPKVDSARDFKLDKFNLKTKAKFLNKKPLFPNLLKKILNHLNPKKGDYYQSERFFENIKDTVREEFTLKYPLVKESMAWEKTISVFPHSISLHIRRGDYIQDKKTNNFHGICDVKYYRQALEKWRQMSGEEKIVLFIFSDDIEWAKENLKFPYQIYFVSDFKIPDYEEMYLMSLCKHNIIANSTFSWWGAWLNQNPNKIIIGPRQWLTNKTATELNILPTTWIQI